MLDFVNTIACEGEVVNTGFNWSAVDISSITTTANGLATVVAPVVITSTGLLVGFKLWKRFSNKI